MIVDVRDSNLSEINNPALRDYASIYVDIYQDFRGQIRSSGIEFDPHDYTEEAGRKLDKLQSRGTVLRNARKSVYINKISPACTACRKGVGSVTLFISLKCHRDCFYCFNPNQEKYDYYQTHTRSVNHELDEIKNQGSKVEHIALTGGEPLLHKERTIAFFAHAQRQFPESYKRLYTCGDHLDQGALRSLQDTGLDEVRFSLRMHDLENGQDHIYDRIAQAKEYIPQVMVEMPVLPDTLEEMKEVLVRLDELGLYSINLLELCYPLSNADVFNEKGYKLKKYPFRVLYNYWYAGGLPVAKSELVCLDLVEFAQDHELNMGVHYCSVENKHTGQIYQQNAGREHPKHLTLSDRDFLLKSAKVFGEDIEPVLRLFKYINYFDYRENKEHNYLEFDVKKVPALTGLKVEVGIASHVYEIRDGETYLRELKVDVTTPQEFTLNDI